MFVIGAIAPVASASNAVPKLEEGMTQEKFASWLAYGVGMFGPQMQGPVTGLEAPVSPAGQGREAINQFRNLGLQPDPKWKRKKETTKEVLASFLPPDILPNDEKQALMNDQEGFLKLADKVLKYAKSLWDEEKKGVFRVHAATPYLPPV